jgi:hypothetical protein
MAPTSDSRRTIGARVHAKATAITSLAECCRLFESLSKTAKVAWTVQDVIIERPNNRAQVWFQVEWEQPSGLKTKEVLAMNVKSGDPPSSTSSPVGTTATHSLAAGGVHRIEDGVHRQDPNPAYSTTMHHPPAHPPTTVIVHGSEWVEDPVLIPSVAWFLVYIGLLEAKMAEF